MISDRDPFVTVNIILLHGAKLIFVRPYQRYMVEIFNRNTLELKILNLNKVGTF